MPKTSKAYLSACLAYKNEASYLREWIEFHRLVGVEHFYLYNHASVDDHREALAPYVEDGVVTLEDWPEVPAAQTDMYNHCLEHYGNDSRWIAFLDTDEFLFSPAGQPLPELLAEYEEWPGVVANWAIYGSSGHRTRPSGLLIESYLWRNDDPQEPRNRLFKCIVDPERVTRCLDPHSFAFSDGNLVDERKKPVEGHLSDRPLYSKIRINHYYTRSEEECLQKYARGRGSDSVKMRGGEAPLEHLHDKLNDKRDDVILRYAPALEKALTEVNRRAPYAAARSLHEAEPVEDGRVRYQDGRVRYLERGQASLRCIEAAVETADRLLPPGAKRSFDRVLDFACGRGRVLRTLKAAFPNAEFTACDTDRAAVDFCAEVFGAVPLYSDEDPARIETEAIFDLIWCGSLFCHIDRPRWPGFLELFETRLRPWGLLVFTTSGHHQITAEMRAEYAQSGFAFHDPGPGRGWGTAVASPAWVCRQLEARPGLRLVTYAERGWNQQRDVVACTRAGPRVLVSELVAAQPTITERELVEVTGYDEPTILGSLETEVLPARKGD